MERKSPGLKIFPGIVLPLPSLPVAVDRQEHEQDLTVQLLNLLRQLFQVPLLRLRKRHAAAIVRAQLLRHGLSAGVMAQVLESLSDIILRVVKVLPVRRVRVVAGNIQMIVDPPRKVGIDRL